MGNVVEALTAAAAHLQAGRLQEAEQLCRQVLDVAPHAANAWQLLGILANQAGRNEEAIACYRRALQTAPDLPGAWHNLGTALKALGRADESIACYQRALQQSPGDPDTLNNLGNALEQLGRSDEALACYRGALERSPQNIAILRNLAGSLRRQGKLEETIATYRRALQIAPGHAEVLAELGAALHEQGSLDAAIACYRKSMQQGLASATTHYNLGLALLSQKALPQAAECFRTVLQLQPDFPNAWKNLGCAVEELEQSESAIECYRRALQQDPADAEACNNLGNVLRARGELDQAIAWLQRALELRPDYAEVYNNLASACKDLGDIDRAVACLHRALQCKPDFARAHSNLVLTLQYQEYVTLAGLFAAHAEFDQRHAVSLQATWQPHANGRDPHRRLRVGFVSPDFAQHPVGTFLIRALESMDPRGCETVCYYDDVLEDPLTVRFRHAAAEWRVSRGWTDTRLADQIRDDRIDILFDLAGHTARNRMLTFARKPAPIQVTWIGSEGTTGVRAIDYLLADRHVVAAGSESGYHERILRLPDAYLCYDPPANASEPGELPAVNNGFVTFGSFHNPAKLNRRVIEVWAAILQRVPRSRLVLKYRGLGNRLAQQRFQQLFAACGVESERLAFEDAVGYAAYLDALGRVDLMLDPFPFAGGITTCDALWMGVPVITCPGETFASRHALSYMSAMGFTETTAPDAAEYVALATAWAHDLPRLASLRAELRRRMAGSPLCDGKRFAENWLALMRQIWQRWCRGGDQTSTGDGSGG